MRVAVAGASGFIGRRVVAALEVAGHQMLAITRDDVARVEAGGPVFDDDRLLATFGRSSVGTTHRPEAIVWAAGKREPTLDANLAIHAGPALRALAETAPIIYLSSGEVYGDAPLPYHEDGPTLSASDYAKAKRDGEAIVLGARGGWVLRMGLVYGPGQSQRMLIPRLVAALRANDRFPMTHGRQTRDLVFVDDVARAIVAAVETPSRYSYARVLNIASGVEVPIREVAEGIARAVGADLSLVGFGEVALRPDEAHRYVMDVLRAREQLGWTATTSLAEGLAQL